MKEVEQAPEDLFKSVDDDDPPGRVPTGEEIRLGKGFKERKHGRMRDDVSVNASDGRNRRNRTPGNGG